MRVIYLTFETAFALGSYWGAYLTFNFFFGSNPYIEHPDYATFIGGLLFLAFGVLTTIMLFREFSALWRQRGVQVAMPIGDPDRLDSHVAARRLTPSLMTTGDLPAVKSALIRPARPTHNDPSLAEDDTLAKDNYDG